MPGSIPADVERYHKEVVEGNPNYSEEQAWATAWSIYCKHKQPGSEHCKQDEYLTKKVAMVIRVAQRFSA